MAVNWQTIEIPFGGGINTKTNPRRLQPPQLEDIQNLVFTDAPGYKSRYGSAVFTSTDSAGAAITVASSLAVHKDQLLLLDNKRLYTYDAKQTEWKYRAPHDNVIFPKVTTTALAGSERNQSIPSTAVLSGVRVTAWVEMPVSGTGNLLISVRDETTGAYLYGPTIVAGTGAATKPLVLASSSNLYVITYNAGSTALQYRKISPSTPDTVGSATSMVTDTDGGLFDAVVDPTDADKFLFIYKRNNGGTPNLSGFVFTASTDSVGTTQTLNSTVNERDVNCLAVAANQTYAFTLASDNAGTITYLTRTGLDLTSASQEDTVAVDAVNVALSVDPASTSDWDGADDMTMWWEIADATNPWAHQVVFSYSGTAFAGAQTMFNCSIASQGWVTNGVSCIVLRHDSEDSSGNLGVQTTYVPVAVLNSKCARPIGRLASGTAAGLSSLSPMTHIFENGTDVFEFPGTVSTKVALDSDSYRNYQTRLFSLDFSAAGRCRSVEMGGVTYITGGDTLFEYDGINLVENVSILFPENVTGTSYSTGSGSLVTSTDYNYRIYYEWINAAGERKRSTTAEVITVSTNTTDTLIELTIPTCPFTWTDTRATSKTNNETELAIVVYRAEGDADVSSGAPFYRVTSLDPTATGTNGFVRNQLNVSTVTFIDGLSDANLITKELDYLNTGELDNVPAPFSEVLGKAKGRLWVAGGTDKNTVYFSKLRFAGDTVSFNETNSVVLPTGDDPAGITAIAELNHFVVFFKKDSIYVVSGDGPDNLGRGFFNEPQRVTSDVGCSEPRSVVSYDGGLLFKSDKGIYRLGQNLQVDYIGAPVESYNSQDITAATLVNDQNQIRFLTSSGRMLVYDYFVNAWTTFTGWTGVSAVNWRNGDVYVWAESDGTVHQEDSSTFEDNGTPVDSSFTTAPITLQGLGGFYRMQRLIFVGDYTSLTRFEVTPYYDGNTTGTEAGILTSALDDNDPFRVVFNMPRQKFSDVKFKITMDKSNSGTSEGVTLQAMRAKVAYKPGLDKLSDGNKFGS